jgi:hypothetical protein
VRGNQARVKNADLRHSSFTVVMQKRKKRKFSSPVFNVLKFTIKTSMLSLLHVSIHLDHPQGAYDDPCSSYAFLELSIKYIVRSFALFWQKVSPINQYIYILFARFNAFLHNFGLQKHMLPQHRKIFNDIVFY